jgi:hypothetical protein
LAIASATINTATAITAALANAVPPPPFNTPFVIATGALGAAQIATIAATKGFAEGGYTGAGGTFEPAGIVHKGEYVVPAWEMRQPDVQPLIAALEQRRLKGYATGGVVGADIPAPPNVEANQEVLRDLIDSNRRLAERPAVVQVVDVLKTSEDVTRVQTVASL